MPVVVVVQMHLLRRIYTSDGDSTAYHRIIKIHYAAAETEGGGVLRTPNLHQSMRRNFILLQKLSALTAI